VPPIFTRIRNE